MVHETSWRNLLPTYGKFGPYSFVFWSSDRGERPHIHVKRERFLAKFWVDDVELASNKGFKDHELRKIQRIVEEQQEGILAFWHDYFND